MAVADMLHLITPDGIHRLPCRHSIQAMTISAGHDRRIISRLGTAFDLQAGNTGIHQIIQMVDHAHIPGVHDIGALLILENREILSGALFFHQRILVTAGLRAGTAVGIAAGHIAGQQTASGITDAHSTVDKRFDLQFLGSLFTDLADLIQAQLSGQNDTLRAQIVPRSGTFIVGDTGLRADVAFTAGRISSRQCKDAHICHNQRIHAGILQHLQMLGQSCHLIVSGHGIHRAMHPHAMLMSKLHCAGQFFGRKIPGKGPHAEAGAGQINSVGTVQHGHFQLFKISCRSQQLRNLSLIHHIHCSAQMLCALSKF